MSQQANVLYQELPENNNVGAVVNLESTVPKLMSDGRLVRVPAEQTAPEVKVEPLVAPDVSSNSNEAAPLNPDMNLLLQTEEGIQQDPPNQPFAAKKVRVSSLVSGILSSTLSSVLTRGMEFTSAKSV